MHSPQSESPVTLEASVRIRDDELLVDFVLENRLTEAIYFYAYPGDLEGEAVLREKAYVSFYDDEAALHVSLLPPAPDDADYLQAVSSLSRRLPAGEEHRASVRLEVPVRPWSPYPPMDLEDTLPFSATERSEPVEGPAAASEPGPGGGGSEAPAPPEAVRIDFDTGWFPESSLVWSDPGPEEGTYWCAGSLFREIRTEIILPRPVPVLLGDEQADEGEESGA